MHVKRGRGKEQQGGDILAPDTAKEKPQQGKVIAVGLGKREKGERVPLDVKEGETILFGKYSGQDIKIDGEEYLIMREDEVLAVLDGSPSKATTGAATKSLAGAKR